jgi:NADPH-dependent glutamate synthase beta subunit-like oxidoreductase
MPRHYIHPNGKKIAIIGAGPAGCSAAHELALMGYKCTIFEVEAIAGGMMYFGIPEYRLSRKVMAAEIAAIEALGVDIIYNTEVGKDITLQELRDNYDSVLISVGCKRSRGLKIPGYDLEGVLQGVDYLHDLNIGMYMQHRVGQKVVVIGGGNVAFDVARSTVRLGRDVTLMCLEARHEMPADLLEIEEGLEEGIRIVNSVGPIEILDNGNGATKGIKVKPCLSVFDENRRFSPKFNENPESHFVIDADTIIMTVGQISDLSFIPPELGLNVTPQNTIQVNPKSLMTNVEGVFAAGDVELGPKIVITCVARGKKAAEGIDSYLNAATRKKVTRVRITNQKGDLMNRTYKPFDGYDGLDRMDPPSIPPEEREKTIQLVEVGYDEEMAQEQAGRCLKCHVVPVFNGDKCILCGGCIDVCPTYCLKFVGLNDIAGSEDLQKVVNNYYGKDIPLDGAKERAQEGTVMLKDEDMCIRCGLCALRCPTQAVTMEHFKFEEVIV